MSLTKCDVKKLVSDHINENIRGRLGYEVLRSSIINNSVPEELMSHLRTSLKNLADAEQAEFAEQLIRSARSAQIEQDKLEAKRDQEEFSEDALLKTKTQELLPQTRLRLDSLEKELDPLLVSFMHAKKRLDEKNQLHAALESESRRVQKELDLLQQSLAENEKQQQINNQLFSKKGHELSTFDAEIMELEQKRYRMQKKLELLQQEAFAKKKKHHPEIVVHQHHHHGAHNTHGHFDAVVEEDARYNREIFSVTSEIEGIVAKIDMNKIKRQAIQNELLHIIPAKQRQLTEQSLSISLSISAHQHPLQRIKTDIALSTVELEQLESTLRPIQRKKEQVEASLADTQKEYKRLNNTLEVDIPHRAKSRQDRLEARNYRQLNQDNPDYHQALSAKNASSLDANIKSSSLQIDRLRDEKYSEARSSANSTYIKTLIAQKQEESATNKEALALCTIYLINNKYIEAQKLQTQAEQELAKSELSLKQKRALLNEKEQLLAKTKESTLNISSELDKLETEKQTLDKSHRFHMRFFKGILIGWGAIAIGGIALGITALKMELSLAALTTFLINLPPVGIALALTFTGIAVASFILAPIVMGISFGINRSRLQQNVDAVESATRNMQIQSSKINELGQDIPVLHKEIGELSAAIKIKNEEVVEKKATTQRLLKQRDAITPSNVNGNELVYPDLYKRPSSANIGFFEDKPSTPMLHKDVLQNDSDGAKCSL